MEARSCSLWDQRKDVSVGHWLHKSILPQHLTTLCAPNQWTITIVDWSWNLLSFYDYYPLDITLLSTTTFHFKLEVWRLVKSVQASQEFEPWMEACPIPETNSPKWQPEHSIEHVNSSSVNNAFKSKPNRSWIYICIWEWKVASVPDANADPRKTTTHHHPT